MNDTNGEVMTTRLRACLVSVAASHELAVLRDEASTMSAGDVARRGRGQRRRGELARRLRRLRPDQHPAEQPARAAGAARFVGGAARRAPPVAACSHQAVGREQVVEALRHAPPVASGRQFSCGVETPKAACVRGDRLEAALHLRERQRRVSPTAL
jgi:hypothetical protein